jgi:hypothetical protein
MLAVPGALPLVGKLSFTLKPVPVEVHTRVTDVAFSVRQLKV